MPLQALLPSLLAYARRYWANMTLLAVNTAIRRIMALAAINREQIPVTPETLELRFASSGARQHRVRELKTHPVARHAADVSVQNAPLAAGSLGLPGPLGGLLRRDGAHGGDVAACSRSNAGGTSRVSRWCRLQSSADSRGRKWAPVPFREKRAMGFHWPGATGECGYASQQQVA